MIKLFEEYVEDFRKKMKSLDKIKNLSIEIGKFYTMVCNSKNYVINSPKVNMPNFRPSYFITFLDDSNETIFICELSLSESMINRNNYSVNIQMQWNIFVSDNNRIKCESFYKYLRPIISPGGFHSVKIEDIDTLISKLNIEDYQNYINIDKYNL